MVHFEVTDVNYCNFSSCIMKLQYLNYILTRKKNQKSKLKNPSFHMRFTNPVHSALQQILVLAASKKKYNKELEKILGFYNNVLLTLTRCEKVENKL